MAGGAKPVCMDVVVLPVPRSADPSASAPRTPAGCRQVRPARRPASAAPRLPLSSSRHVVTHVPIERILDALQQICYESGLATQRRDIPSVRKANCKTSRNIKLPLGSATPSLSHVALTSRTPLVLARGPAHLTPLRLPMPTSFPPRPVLRHIPPPLPLVYSSLVSSLSYRQVPNGAPPGHY